MQYRVLQQMTRSWSRLRFRSKDQAGSRGRENSPLSYWKDRKLIESLCMSTPAFPETYAKARAGLPRTRPARSFRSIGVSSRQRTDRARVRMWNDAALPDVSRDGFANRGSISRAARHADVLKRHRITRYVDRHISRVDSRNCTFSRPSASNSAPKPRRRGMPGRKTNNDLGRVPYCGITK